MRCDLETLALSLAVTGFLIPAVTLMALGAGYPSTTVADWEPAIHLGNARLLEFGYLNVPADATLL